MKVLADENISAVLVAKLRKRGHDAESALMLCPGAPDHRVLEMAIELGRTLVTQDKEFAASALRDSAQRENGIFLIRLGRLDRDTTMELIADSLKMRRDWRGVLGVLKNNGLRIRELKGRLAGSPSREMHGMYPITCAPACRPARRRRRWRGGQPRFPCSAACWRH
jgi:predicted nuclease of predicted toxin-antitoxin system